MRPYIPCSVQIVHHVHLFICQPRRAGARTVRPYMPRSIQLVYPVHLFIYQLRGVDARAVRPYIAIMGMLRGNGYSACVPDAVG